MHEKNSNRGCLKIWKLRTSEKQNMSPIHMAINKLGRPATTEHVPYSHALLEHLVKLRASGDRTWEFVRRFGIRKWQWKANI